MSILQMTMFSRADLRLKYLLVIGNYPTNFVVLQKLYCVVGLCPTKL